MNSSLKTKGMINLVRVRPLQRR